MALEDIQKKIIADAENTKTKLLQDADRQKEAILEEGKKIAQEYMDDSQKTAQTTAENLERGLVIDARRKLANEILARKRKKIEQIFLQAKEDFLQSSDYPVIMSKMIAQYSQTKKEQIILSANEKTLDQKWLDALNADTKGSFTFASQKENFAGGVLLTDGDTLINITVDTLFGLLREQAEKPVADMLFGR